MKIQCRTNDLIPQVKNHLGKDIMAYLEIDIKIKTSMNLLETYILFITILSRHNIIYKVSLLNGIYCKKNMVYNIS